MIGRGSDRSRGTGRRVYVAEALDLWICASCRSATVGPATCDHSAPIRVTTRSDVEMWWRLRVMSRPSREAVHEIVGMVDGDRVRRAMSVGRSPMPPGVARAWFRVGG